MGTEEILHIGISVLTIGIAFSMQNIAAFPAVLLTVGLAFVLHELAHKFVAISYGARAEYRAWTWGLLLAVAMAALTQGRFVFAAPGAVYVFGQRALNKQQNGIISLAGPATNLALAAVFLSLPLGAISASGALINIYLGMFNMLPIPPLDGSKVAAWNGAVWAGVFVLFLILLFQPIPLGVA